MKEREAAEVVTEALLSTIGVNPQGWLAHPQSFPLGGWGSPPPSAGTLGTGSGLSKRPAPSLIGWQRTDRRTCGGFLRGLGALFSDDALKAFQFGLTGSAAFVSSVRH